MSSAVESHGDVFPLQHGDVRGLDFALSLGVRLESPVVALGDFGDHVGHFSCTNW